MLGERLDGAFRARKISRRELVRLYRLNVLAHDFSRENGEYDQLLAKLARAVGTEIAPSGLLPVKGRRERL